MPKAQSQKMLVTALRSFTGKLPPGYTNEKEFFLTSLQNMAEYMEDLQKETLKEHCDGFCRKLDAGAVTLQTIEEFKAGIDRLVSASDFKTVSAAMAGSREFIKKCLFSLAPVSMIGEEKKTAERDPESERRIKEAYSRLNFPALLKKVENEPNDISVNAAVARAREEIASYCCLYRVPLDPANTLTPFSLSCVDAALAASYRFFKNIRQAAGHSM